MSATQSTIQSSVVDVTPELLETWIADGSAQLIDVREDYEHATERIDSAINHPLSTLDCASLRDAYPNQRLVFHCRSGGRSSDAATRFMKDDENTFHLAGGIQAWKAASKPTIRSESAPKLDIMRQVQIVAGSLILLGVILGLSVHIGFIGLSAFVGAGLTFAGLTGWCGMAMLLGKMPWNKVACTTCAVPKSPQSA